MRRPGFAVQFLEPDAVFVDLCLDVAVSRAGNAHPDRAGGAMARQTNHAHIVGEVLAAELGADSEFLGCFDELLLQFHVAEGLTVLVPFGGEIVIVLG